MDDATTAFRTAMQTANMSSLYYAEAELQFFIAKLKWCRFRFSTGAADACIYMYEVAEAELKVAEARFQVAKVMLEEAQVKGDKHEVAKVKIRVAEAELKIAEARFQVDKVVLEEAQVKGDKHEVAKVKIRVAEAELKIAEARFQVDKVMLEEAQVKGDEHEVAKVKIRVAEAELMVAEARFQVAKVMLEEAQVKGDKHEVAKVKIRVAEAELKIAEARFQVDKVMLEEAQVKGDEHGVAIVRVAEAKVKVAEAKFKVAVAVMEETEVNGDEHQVAKAKVKVAEAKVTFAEAMLEEEAENGDVHQIGKVRAAEVRVAEAKLGAAEAMLEAKVVGKEENVTEAQKKVDLMQLNVFSAEGIEPQDARYKMVLSKLTKEFWISPHHKDEEISPAGLEYDEAFLKISKLIAQSQAVDPSDILTDLTDSAKLLHLPFLAACIPGDKFQDNRVNVKPDYVFPFHGRRALKNYISQTQEFIMSISSPQMKQPSDSDESSLMENVDGPDDYANKLIVTGISGSGKSYMTAALVYYLTCCYRNTCRIIYIASCMAFIKNPILYLKCAFKIAFYNDLSTKEKESLENCTNHTDLVAFLWILKQRIKIDILFVVDQFNAFDTEKYMKDAIFKPKDRHDAKLILIAVMSSYKRVLVMSPSDDCANVKSGIDDLLSVYLDLSKPLEHDEWVNWTKAKKRFHPSLDKDYLYTILGEKLELLTDGISDEEEKVISIIQYLSGRHCLFYSWFYISKPFQGTPQKFAAWHHAVMYLEFLSIQKKVRDICELDSRLCEVLELCVLKITTTKLLLYNIQQLRSILAKVYAYVVFEENHYRFDVAGEFVRNQIRYALRSYVQSHEDSIIKQRFSNIVSSLHNESHASNFGLTMEDAVILQLETSEIILKLFSHAVGVTAMKKNFKVSRFSEEMKNLVLSKYSPLQNQLLLLLPERENNDWVDAIIVFEKRSRIYILGIQITISYLTKEKISNTNKFLAHVEKQKGDEKQKGNYKPFVFFICSGAPYKVCNWWHFREIHPDLGLAMDNWNKKNDQTYPQKGT